MKYFGRYKRKAILIFSLFTFFGFTSAGLKQSDLEKIISRIIGYTNYVQSEKIYIHLDRSIFSPGDDIWFSLSLINASDPSLKAKSEIAYVELIDFNNGLLLNRKVVHVVDGQATGDFHLDDIFKEGSYLIRGYTNHMKNFSDSLYFQTIINIYSEETITSTDNCASVSAIDLQFLPEGGSFLAGIENRIALKATDACGMDVSVTGKIVDSNRNLVTKFETTHAGMGLFKMVPMPNVSYTGIVYVGQDSVLYKMPSVETEGYSLRVTDLDEEFKVSVIASNGLLNVAGYLVIQSNGIPRYSVKGMFKNGSLVTYVKKNIFPTGIAQITLLNDSLIPQCERLLFINHYDLPDIKLSGTKEEYGKREKILINGRVSEKTGLGIQGHFSLSVQDASNIDERELFPETIVSSLLLTSDLSGIIRNPSYYFKDTLGITKKNLDLVMLTHGWRRFKWENILSDSNPQFTYPVETGLQIRGKVTPGRKSRDLGLIKVFIPGYEFISVNPSNSGEFIIDGLIYYDSVNLVIETDNKRGEPKEFDLTLLPFTQSPTVNKIKLVPKQWSNLESFLKISTDSKRVQEAIGLENDVRLLDTVVVKASRIKPEDDDQFGPSGWSPKIRVEKSQLFDGYQNAAEALRGVVPGVNVTGEGDNTIISIRGIAAILLYDGMRVDANFMTTVRKSEIDHVDIVKEGGYGRISTGGVVAFFSTRFASITNEIVGITTKRYPGLSRAREFYSPSYDKPADRHKFPDLRRTLYWSPHITTDSSGTFDISFFTGDVSSKYNIVIHGMSKSGKPISYQAEFSVR